MGEYKFGSMDISEQEKTFDGFAKMLVRSFFWIAVILIFLAIFGA